MTFCICTVCGRKTRVRKDGRSARHAGFDRHRKASWHCVGSLSPVTTAAQNAASAELRRLNG